jgi:hypothetical protein
MLRIPVFNCVVDIANFRKLRHIKAEIAEVLFFIVKLLLNDFQDFVLSLVPTEVVEFLL